MTDAAEIDGATGAEARAWRQALGETPDPGFTGRLRRDLRATHARANRRLWWFGAESPAGPLRVVHDGEVIHFVTNDAGRFEDATLAQLGFVPGAGEHPALRAAVAGVLAGRLGPRGLVFLGGLAPFHRRVLEETAAIPRGEVRTYGWLARRAGSPLAVRAAGTALAQNPVPFVVPCHRVLRGDWRLGNYSAAGGAATKERLLRAEGVDVDRLLDLAGRGLRLQGSRSTHIFCLPTCRSGKHLRPVNLVSFEDEHSARAAGYRPCRLCQPGS